MSGRRSLLQLDTTENDAEIIVRAVGVLDISTVDVLMDLARDRLADGRPVLVDMSGVSMCDSTGLGGIVALERDARAREAVFAVRSPGRHVSRMLALTGIDRVVRILRIPDQPSTGR